MSDDISSNLAQQRALYGEPLRDLADRVMAALGLTQRGLAEALGLSAPMLSQLLSGRRVKIGNPAVVHRLQSLLALADEAPDLTAAQVAERLVSVRDVQGTLTGPRATGSDEHVAVLAGLRRVASARELAEAASVVTAAHPKLAALLQEAAAEDARG